jgi:hypothetical protein
MSDDQPGNQSGPTPPSGGHQPNWGNAYPPPQPQPQPQPGYQQPYYAPPKHPQATTAMVLGILGIAVCGLCAPFAWSIGGKAVKEIDANPTAYSGRGEANAGKIMGIIGTCLIVVGIVAAVGLIAIGVAVESSSS